MKKGYQEKERAHFDALADKTGDIWWGHQTEAGRQRLARHAELCVEFLRGAGCRRVLELGCGAGTFTLQLAQRLPEAELLAVDISPRSLALAETRLQEHPSVSLGLVDLLDPEQLGPISDPPFDAIVGNSVLHHLELEQLLPSLYGLLREGGVLWFSEPNLLNPQVALEKKVRPIGALLQNTEDETAFVRWRLAGTLRRHGFSEATVRPYDFLHPALPEASIKLARLAEQLLEQTPVLKELSGSLVVTARRPALGPEARASLAEGAGTQEELQPESAQAFALLESRRKTARLAKLEAWADRRDKFRARHKTYYQEIEHIARFHIPAGARVLEVGCSTGDLLAALKPSMGLGLDLSPALIRIAKQKHPALDFGVADLETLGVDTLPEPAKEAPLDWIVMSDVAGYLDDVWAAFRNLRRLMGPQTKLLVTWYNYLWEPVIEAGEALGLKMPVPAQNWLSEADLENLLTLNGLQVCAQSSATLLPVPVPFLAPLLNRGLARLPGLRRLALQRSLVARPVGESMPAALGQPQPKGPSCTVVVPCRNELGNVEAIFERVPEMGAFTELLFVDGNSEDGTVAAIEARLGDRPGSRLLLQGDGVGKGDAVRKGFAAAKGDILFILDADLTVPPEDLPKFYLAIAEGRGEFINGSRLVYPMEGDAMRLLNTLGNKFFGQAFSFILDQRLKDTLCGTKVLSRENYERIANGRSYFGDFDPFGDFDLLFGAAKLGLKIVELPVRYRRRTYGDTKINRFKHGLILLQMTALAARKFKL